MTYPIWPTTLPDLLIADHDETLPNTIARSEVDAGPAKTRNRFSNNVRPVNGKVLLTTEQRDIFEAFYLRTCAGGATPFLWRDFSQADTSGLSTFGSCLQMSGASQFVRVPDHATLSQSSSQAMTIEFWLKLRDLNAVYGVLAKLGEYAIFKPTAGNLSFYAWKTGDVLLFNNFATPASTVWNHYAWVVDNAGGTPQSKLYINGGLQSTVSRLTSGSLFDGTANLEIGKVVAGAETLYGDFMIDDVRIWSTVRSASDIADNMDAELAGDESGLVAYWRFNEQYGIQADDTTANENHGVVIGAKYYPAQRLYRFTKPPKISPASGHLYWTISMEMECLP